MPVVQVSNGGKSFDAGVTRTGNKKVNTPCQVNVTNLDIGSPHIKEFQPKICTVQVDRNEGFTSSKFQRLIPGMDGGYNHDIILNQTRFGSEKKDKNAKETIYYEGDR